MQIKEFTIVNRLGLHARAAAQLVQCANRYRADIQVEKEGERVNCKSIMGILMLAACQGSTLTLFTDGEDEAEAMNALAELINDGFGED